MNRALLSGPALATAVGALILVTPLCGWLFGCGCAWPWAGFVSNCASLGGPAGPLCPWCEQPVAGVIAVAGAIIAGTGTAVNFFSPPRMSSGRRPLAPNIARFLVETVFGIAIFAIVAVIMAILLG